MILTGRQIREARMLTGMEQVDLANGAGVALALVVWVEAIDGMAMMREPDAVAVRAVLEVAGVDLVDQDGGGPGVRLRKLLP